MTVINSVLGPLNTNMLGLTLMHEHLMVGEFHRSFPELFGDGFMNRIINGLARAKQGGIDTIVDATTIDLGRDINIMVEASRKTGVNIVACTGWWLKIPSFPDATGVHAVSADLLAQLFIREIQEGIDGTDIKAGIIKSASDISGVTLEEEEVLRAVARAHLQTNVPIMLHSYSPGQVGKKQLAILKREGVDLRKVKVDHSNDTTDVEYLTWLLGQGCYLGMDRYPGRGTSPQARTKTLKALIDAGYEDRLLPSHDWPLVRAAPKSPLAWQKEREEDNPYGILYLKTVVFAELRKMGVAETTLNRMCVDNPRCFFEGA